MKLHTRLHDPSIDTMLLSRFYWLVTQVPIKSAIKVAHGRTCMQVARLTAKLTVDWLMHYTLAYIWWGNAASSAGAKIR